MIGSDEDRNGGRLYETEKTPEAVVLRKTDKITQPRKHDQKERKKKCNEDLIDSLPVDVIHPV